MRIGLPVDHNVYYAGPVCWRYCNLSLRRVGWDEAAAQIDAHVAGIKRRTKLWKASGIKVGVLS